MASDLPDSLQLRDIKYGEKSTSQAQLATGEALLAAGRTAEALDLFLIVDDAAAVERIRKLAVTNGRPSLLMAIELRGGSVSKEEWKTAGEGAMQAARWREAYRCFLRAEDEEALARAQEKVPDYEPYAP